MPFESKLMRACVELDITKAFEAIESGADINCKFTAKEMALIDKSYSNSTKQHTPLQIITAKTLAMENQPDSADLFRDGLQLISLLLQQKVSTVGEDPSSTLLHEILHKGCSDIVEVFIKNMPILATKKDKDGNTPLHIACQPNEDNIFKSLINVEWLIRHGVYSINAQNHLSETPVMIAANYTKNDPCIPMRHEIVSFLTKNNADLSMVDVLGNSPLILASYNPKLREAIINGGYTQPIAQSPAKKPKSPAHAQSNNNLRTPPHTNNNNAGTPKLSPSSKKKLF